jgi:hypothetical protein
MVTRTIRPLLSETQDSIKVLDLLTNRYHLGVIRESSAAAMRVELPASSHFHAGQRVRFIVGSHQPLVSRTEMQRAFVTNVSPPSANRQSIRLALLTEAAAVA